MHLDIFQVHLQYFKFSTNWPSLAVGLLATKNFTKKFTKNSNRFYSNFKCSSNISSQLKIGLGPGPAKCRRQIGLVPSLQSQTSLQGFYLFDMSYVMTHTNSVTRNSNKRSASVPSSGPADARHTPVMLQSVAAASAAPSCSLA